MTDEELKQIEERLKEYEREASKHKIASMWHDTMSERNYFDAIALLAGYKERDAEVKRLKERVEELENTNTSFYDNGWQAGFEDRSPQ